MTTQRTADLDAARNAIERARLVRRLAVAWGRLEACVWPRPGSDDALAIAGDAARRAAETAASVRAAATG